MDADGSVNEETDCEPDPLDVTVPNVNGVPNKPDASDNCAVKIEVPL